MSLKAERKDQEAVWPEWGSDPGTAWTSVGIWRSLEPFASHDRYAAHCRLHSRQQVQRELITVDSLSDFSTLLLAYAKATSERVDAREMRLAVLEKVVLELRHSIAELSSCKTILVPISSLAPEPFVLDRTLFAVVEPIDDEFVATFYDANINASGDTRDDAVENLKDVLVSTFRRYGELGENQLGAGARKQFAVLKSILTAK